MAKFTAEQLLNHLYNKRLPQVYREADIDAQYCLKRFLQSMIEGGFAETISLADGITDLTDPLKCPDKYFPILFESFGYKYSSDIPIIYQRKILQNHGELFQKRGSIEYIYVLTRILTGFDCSVDIERVNGVRVLSISMFVDNSVTSTEKQHYVNLVKKYVTEGYIPFYLDVETNIIVDVVDISTAPQYIASAVEVEGIVDISPIEEVSFKGLTTSISPTLDKEPFSEFNILGYSKIVPKYEKGNLINPNTAQQNIRMTWVDTDSNTNVTVASMSLLSEYAYVPYGNTLYLYLSNPSIKAPTVYIFVYTYRGKRAIGNKTVSSSSFVQGKAVVDISNILTSDLCEDDYYVKIGFIDNQGVSDVTTLLSAWVEDVGYSEYSATTRLKFDSEYYRNGEYYPTYMVDIYDSNGAIGYPYVSEKDIDIYDYYEISTVDLYRPEAGDFVAYTDCTTAMKDDYKYYVSFIMLSVPETNTMDAPILTALCTNNKGAFKEVTLDKDFCEKSNNMEWHCGYSFTVPHDYNVVRIKYLLCNSSEGYGISIANLMCFECDLKTGNPLIDVEHQPYRLALEGYSAFENNFSVGIDGIELLSYNDSNGKVIVRDSFDVLTGTLTHRVGVTYDSLGNPVSVYALPTPYKEVITEDLNGEVKPCSLKTFRGKTYISMSQSVPNSRYVNRGGTDYHSGIDFKVRIIK